MATINIEILNAAADDGVFERGHEPNSNQRLYFHDSILTAWSIILLIDAHPTGISHSELAEMTQLNRSTIVVYCQWLKDRVLVEFNSTSTRGTPHYHYPLDPSGLGRGKAQY
jgi:hypothetical protein